MTRGFTPENGRALGVANRAITQSVIPDSAIHQWKFDEGSGSTAGDSIGSADGTISGAVWSSGTWVGGYALDGDGTDDYVATSPLGTWGSSLYGTWGVAYSFQASNLSNDQWVAGADSSSTSGDSYFQLPISWDGPAWNGNPAVRIQDDAGATVSYASSTAFDDGSPHRVVIQSTATGLTDTEIEIWVDGSKQTLEINESGSISDSFSDFTSDLHWFCRWLDGSTSLFADVILDNAMIFNDSLTDQEIQDDYDRQPWS